MKISKSDHKGYQVKSNFELKCTCKCTLNFNFFCVGELIKKIVNLDLNPLELTMFAMQQNVFIWTYENIYTRRTPRQLKLTKYEGVHGIFLKAFGQEGQLLWLVSKYGKSYPWNLITFLCNQLKASNHLLQYSFAIFVNNVIKRLQIITDFINLTVFSI